MLIGGYPEVVSRKTETRRQDWFASYLATILQRDVRDLANIEGLTDMPRLLSMLAARAGGLLNVAEISRSIGFSQMTLHRYMALLEKVFLIETVPAWSGSLKSRLVKAPKIFITDTGLLSYLQGLNLKKLNSEPTLMGSLTENFVVTELKKQLGWGETRAEMFHFRTSNDREVDIILENRAGELVGIEVKASSSVNPNDFKSLQMLADSLPKKFKRGIILYAGNQFLSFGKNLYLVPITALWS
jgi:predicted AAA+ superfamily ATPase